MHDNKPDQFVDELLEAALKRYGGEEPRAGAGDGAGRGLHGAGDWCGPWRCARER
jgi:hypothetical protein